MAQPQVQVHHTTATNRFEGGGTTGGVYPKHHYDDSGFRSLFSERGPSTSQMLSVLLGVPISGTLLFLAGISLIVSLIGLAVATPLFILFSPVLVPATLAVGLAVAGILTSGACGLTGLMSLSWVVRYIREMQGTLPGQRDTYNTVKGRVADMAGYVGQKTKEAGQEIQTKAHEAKRTT